MSEDSVYTDRILKYWERAQRVCRPTAVTHTHTERTPICGDMINIEANIQDGKLRELEFFPLGCCMCEAATAMLRERVLNKSVDEIRLITEQDMLRLFGGEIPNQRRECVLLAWKGLMRLLNETVT